MAATAEGRVKSSIDKVLDGYRRAGLWYFKPVSAGYGAHGIPDYIGCFFGQMFVIEAKAPGRKPTQLQLLQMSLIDNAGGKVFIIDGDLGELRVYLEHMVSAAAYEH
jgi:hypothetical protein